MHATPKPTSHLYGSCEKNVFSFRSGGYHTNTGTSLAYAFTEDTSMTTDSKDSVDTGTLKHQHRVTAW